MNLDQKTTIKFGTDGWRAVIGDEFTFDNVSLCAQGVALYLGTTHQEGDGVVIGYDTRFLSSEFARTTAEVLAGNGIKVFLSDRAVPTPVVSYSVKNLKACAGVVITASHNPARWNGFKLKSPDGASASEEAVAHVEKFISALHLEEVKSISLKQALESGMVDVLNLSLAYKAQINSLLDLDIIRNSGLKIAVDSMHGAGGGYFKSLLGEALCQVVEIKSEPNPSFPGMKQPEPIGGNLLELSETVTLEKAAVGLATDGDADRLGIVDEHGNFMTQLQVYALLAYYFLEVRGERGAIVKTITTTNMLNRLGEIYNVPVLETPVGFKYVAPVMIRENALIGGEESGGYGFRGHVPERDGLLAGLYFLDFMARTGKTPSMLLERLYSVTGRHFYDRRDVLFSEANRRGITDRLAQASPEFVFGAKVLRKESYDGFRFILADGSWLLIRFSGTEPLLRIYAESNSLHDVRRLLDTGLKLAGVKDAL